MPSLILCCSSSYGKRKLMLWCRVGDIEERLATTELFMRHPAAADAFQAGIHRAPDVERLLTRTSAVLLGVVEKVAEAHDADEAAAEQQQQQQQQAPAAASRWSAPNPRPPSEEQRRLQAASHVEQLAAVLDLSQATFLPAVQLFEGAGMLLEALHTLRGALLAERSPARHGGREGALLPPPIQRAVMRGEAVAQALQHLCQVCSRQTKLLSVVWLRW